jgi:hypothetical protein
MREQANILECRQGELPLFPSPRRGTHIPGGSSCRIYPRNPRKHPQKIPNFSIFQYLALWRVRKSGFLRYPVQARGTGFWLIYADCSFGVAELLPEKT